MSYTEGSSEYVSQQNKLVVQSLGPLWFRNIINNEDIIRRSRNVNELYGKGAGIPAVLVGSGPSLDSNIHLLKDLRERKAMIIACDSAYIPLLEAGVMPHIVVSLDPKPHNARFFDGTLSYQKHTKFVCATLVSKDVIQSWRYPVYFFNPKTDGPESEFFNMLPYLVGNLGAMGTGGNVLSAATMLALWGLRSSMVVFVGADYCWYSDQHHVKGSSVSKFHGDIEEVSDIYGRRAFWNDALKLYWIWAKDVFSSSLMAEDGVTTIPVFNCTEGGMLSAEGVHNMPLQFAIDNYLFLDHGNIEDYLNRENH